MIHTKRVIFMILPLLFVPLVYGMSSTPDACAAPRLYEVCSKVPGKPDTEECCWFERDEDGNETQYCQTCTGKGTDVVICEDPETASIQQPPAPTPAPGPFVLPEDGVLQQPTPAPAGPFAPLGGGGILQQPLTTPATPAPPPQFGRNAPLGGGVLGQPLTTITTPAPTPTLPPLFGQNLPQELPPLTETPPSPLPPPPTGPSVFPKGGEVLEKPEVEEEEQEEEQPSGDEGQDTAGPLT